MGCAGSPSNALLICRRLFTSKRFSDFPYPCVRVAFQTRVLGRKSRIFRRQQREFVRILSRMLLKRPSPRLVVSSESVAFGRGHVT